MRLVVVAGLAFALAACGGDGGEELAAGNSQLSSAQVDAALGPADQSGADDGLAADPLMNGLGNAGEAGPANNSAAEEEREQ